MAPQIAIKKRIIGSYRNLIIRTYCYIRFLIMNMRILEEIEQYLPKTGRVLDVGCGFGLFSLRERLSYLGGRVVLDSGPGRGTRVVLEVSLRPESREDS